MPTYTICPISGATSRLHDPLSSRPTTLIQPHPLYQPANADRLAAALRNKPTPALLASSIIANLTQHNLIEHATPANLARLNIGLASALTPTQLQSILDCTQVIAPIAHNLPHFSGEACAYQPVETFTQYLITLRDVHKVQLRLSWVMQDMTKRPISNGYRISSAFAHGAPASDYKRQGPSNISYSLDAILPRITKSVRQIAAKALGPDKLMVLLNMIQVPEDLTDAERAKAHTLLTKILERGIATNHIGKRSTLKVSYDTLLNILAPDTETPDLVPAPLRNLPKPATAPALAPITLTRK